MYTCTYVQCCRAGSLLQLLNGPVAKVAKSSTELVTWKHAFLVGSESIII